MTITSEKPPTVDQLLQAARRLDEAELDRLYAGLGRMRQPKMGRVLSAEETRLLRRINAVPSEDWVPRYLEPCRRLRSASIEAQELAELQALTHTMEAYQAERAEWLLQLARIRGVSVAQVVADFGIRPPLDG